MHRKVPIDFHCSLFGDISRAFAEIKSYIGPPKIIHDIVKAVLEIYYDGKEDAETREKMKEWTNCRQLVNADLVTWLSTFDPTESTNLAVNGERLAKNLSSKKLLLLSLLFIPSAPVA